MSRKAEVDAAVADLDFANKSYQIQLETSAGDIHLDLLPDVAPGHCKNMIGLARIGYYDGLVFHRVISGFMIQGGCPDGNGMGGPGYNVNQEFNDTPHVAGVSFRWHVLAIQIRPARSSLFAWVHTRILTAAIQLLDAPQRQRCQSSKPLVRPQ